MLFLAAQSFISPVSLGTLPLFCTMYSLTCWPATAMWCPSPLMSMPKLAEDEEPPREQPSGTSASIAHKTIPAVRKVLREFITTIPLLKTTCSFEQQGITLLTRIRRLGLGLSREKSEKSKYLELLLIYVGPSWSDATVNPPFESTPDSTGNSRQRLTGVRKAPSQIDGRIVLASNNLAVHRPRIAAPGHVSVMMP